MVWFSPAEYTPSSFAARRGALRLDRAAELWQHKRSPAGTGQIGAHVDSPKELSHHG